MVDLNHWIFMRIGQAEKQRCSFELFFKATLWWLNFNLTGSAVRLPLFLSSKLVKTCLFVLTSSRFSASDAISAVRSFWWLILGGENGVNEAETTIVWAWMLVQGLSAKLSNISRSSETFLSLFQDWLSMPSQAEPANIPKSNPLYICLSSGQTKASLVVCTTDYTLWFVMCDPKRDLPWFLCPSRIFHFIIHRRIRG